MHWDSEKLPDKDPSLDTDWLVHSPFIPNRHKYDLPMATQFYIYHRAQALIDAQENMQRMFSLSAITQFIDENIMIANIYYEVLADTVVLYVPRQIFSFQVDFKADPRIKPRESDLNKVIDLMVEFQKSEELADAVGFVDIPFVKIKRFVLNEES